MNREQEKLRAVDSDELDRALDGALSKYVEAEPRAGLESRILANLHAQPARTQIHAWWHWGLAMVAAVVVVAAILIGRPARPPHPVVADRSTSEKHDSSKQAPQIAGSQRTPKPMPIHRPRANATGATARALSNLAIAAASPKLESFPSPRPLSPQEQMLVSYVARFHKQAVLIAEVTNEESRQERAAMFGSEKMQEADMQDVESGK